MKDYTWIGKPRGDARGGVGFWIHNKILTRISLTETEDKNPSIMWIKFVGDKSTLHMAIVYSRPDKIMEHKQIITTLDANVTELEQSGAILISGDFNSKLTHLSNQGRANYKLGTYEHTTWKFIAKHEKTAPEHVAACQIRGRSDTPWDFQHMAGQSDAKTQQKTHP